MRHRGFFPGFFEIVRKNLTDSQENSRSADTEGPAPVGSLFIGFPQISENRDPIVLTGNGGNRSFNLAISTGLFVEQQLAGGMRRLVKQKDQSALLESVPIPALEITNGAKGVILPLEHLKLYATGRIPFRGDASEGQRIQCVFVRWCSRSSSAGVGSLSPL